MGYYAKRFFGKKIEEPRDPDFVITVDTNLQYGGFTNTRIFEFDFSGSGYDCVVNWGDGTSTAVVGQGKATRHTYKTPGIYQIRVQGQMPRISHNYPYYFDKNKIISLDNWGNSIFDTCKEMFYNAKNMEANYTDIPNTSNVSDFSRMFSSCSKFNGKIEFDMNNAVTTENMFAFCYVFNQYVEFDSPLLTSCVGMFSVCSAFNQPINFIRRPADIFNIIQGCTSYKQSLANWNVELLRGASNSSAYQPFVSSDINEPGTTDNYDNTLISWGNQNILPNPGGIEFKNCKYSSAGKVGRDQLIAKGLRIRDGGMI